jgi:hypothetical protein
MSGITSTPSSGASTQSEPFKDHEVYRWWNRNDSKAQHRVDTVQGLASLSALSTAGNAISRSSRSALGERYSYGSDRGGQQAAVLSQDFKQPRSKIAGDPEKREHQSSLRRCRRWQSTSVSSSVLRLPLFTIVESNELLSLPQGDSCISRRNSAPSILPFSQLCPNMREEQLIRNSQRRTRLILGEAIRQTSTSVISSLDTLSVTGAEPVKAKSPFSDGLLEATLRTEALTHSLLYSPTRPARSRSPPPG